MTDQESSRGRIVFAGLVVAITLLGAWLRLNGLGNKCLWCDEALSYLLATYSFEEIVQKCLERSSTHPPLFFLMLHVWRNLFGDSEFSLRLPAALLGIAAIPTAFILARSLLAVSRPTLSTRVRDTSCLCFSALIALTPMQIFSGRQIRGYSLGVFLWLITSLALVRAVSSTKHRVRWLTLFVIAAAAQCYTHHVCVLMVLAQGLFLLLTAVAPRFRRSQSSLEPPAGCQLHPGTVIAAGFVLLLLYLPGLLFTSKQAAAATTTFERTFSWQQIPNDVFFSFFGTFARRWSVDIIVSVLFTSVVVAVLSSTLFLSRFDRRYFAFTAFLPLTLMLVYSVMCGRVLIHTRYLVFPMTACLGLFALLLSSLSERGLLAGLLILANVCVFGIVKSWDSIGPTAKPGMRAAAQLIVDTTDQKAEVYCAGPVEYFRLRYYLRDRNPPKLLVTDDSHLFWGRRYVRREDTVLTTDFSDQSRNGDWLVTESHKLSAPIRLDLRRKSNSVASFHQEFRWEKRIRLRRIIPDRRNANDVPAKQ